MSLLTRGCKDVYLAPEVDSGTYYLPKGSTTKNHNDYMLYTPLLIVAEECYPIIVRMYQGSRGGYRISERGGGAVWVTVKY